MNRATRDPNNIPTAMGVDKTLLITPTEAAVNPANGAWLVENQEAVPTDTSFTNPSLVLVWDVSNNLTSITQTIGTDQYQKTLTWDATNNLTNLSKWIKL